MNPLDEANLLDWDITMQGLQSSIWEGKGLLKPIKVHIIYSLSKKICVIYTSRLRTVKIVD